MGIQIPPVEAGGMGRGVWLWLGSDCFFGRWFVSDELFNG